MVQCFVAALRCSAALPLFWARAFSNQVASHDDSENAPNQKPRAVDLTQSDRKSLWCFGFALAAFSGEAGAATELVAQPAFAAGTANFHTAMLASSDITQPIPEHFALPGPVPVEPAAQGLENRRYHRDFPSIGAASRAPYREDRA